MPRLGTAVRVVCYILERIYMRKFISAILLTLSFATSASAYANDYTIIMGRPAGSPTELVLQKFATAVKSNGVNITAEYHTGSRGAAAVSQFLESKDPNVLLWASPLVAENILKPAGLTILTPDMYRPVVLVSRSNWHLATTPNSKKITSVDQLFDKNCTSRVTIATGGTTAQLIGEILKARSSCQIVQIQYASIVNAMSDVMSSSVDLVVIDPVTAPTLISAGGKVLATTGYGTNNTDKFPELRKFIPGIENTSSNFFILASKNMDDATYQKLVQNIKTTWSNRAIRDAHSFEPERHYEPIFGNDLAQFIDKIVKDLNQLRQ
jgi:tripartite-type tricarboxylate transporter receptor subunit TctC